MNSRTAVGDVNIPVYTELLGSAPEPVGLRIVELTYEPEFSLFVAGNHKPSFRGVDEAIRRRVLLLPFLQNIPANERDPVLPQKLQAEWPAILCWMVDGCLEWQRVGLQPPASVRVATDDYLNAEDILGQLLDEIASCRPSWAGSHSPACTGLGSPGVRIEVNIPAPQRRCQRNSMSEASSGRRRSLGPDFGASPSRGGGRLTEMRFPHNTRSDPPDVRAPAYADYGDGRHFRQPPEGQAEDIDL